MKIFFNNRKLTFNIKLDNSNIIRINNTKVKYDDYVTFLKTSLEHYVSFDIGKEEETFENYFTYFKITTNPLVKENMTSKIIYFLINSYDHDNNIFKNKKINDLLDSYIYKSDKYFNFLKITLRIESIKSLENKVDVDFEEDKFDILDFIIDYYI